MTEPRHTLGRYELGARLALGGMAEVWVARQTGPAGFSKDVVVKKILPHLTRDSRYQTMFLNEARLAALLDHPNVVHTVDFGEADGSFFLVMEYVRGVTLRQLLDRLLERREKLPLGAVAHLFEGIAEGLHYAHELPDADGRPLQLVHGDVSPENVLIGWNGLPKIADFGIARPSSKANTSSMRGKFAYMSPEQIQGQGRDRRTDLFSLGVVLYETLASERPFRGPTDAHLLRNIVLGIALPLDEVAPATPAELRELVARLLSGKPADRPADAREVVRVLRKFHDRDFGLEQMSQLLRTVFPQPGRATPDDARATVEPTADVPAGVELATTSKVAALQPAGSLPHTAWDRPGTPRPPDDEMAATLPADPDEGGGRSGS